MNFDENFVFKLKNSIDICTIISDYVDLKTCGLNMRCCCPFHAEKTPSFFVYSSTQSFYCFGCGVGGDVITFIEKIEKLSYVEALRFLANKTGLELPNCGAYVDDIKKKKLVLHMNKTAAQFFYQNLINSNGIYGLNYLKMRNINRKTAVKFGLGCALNEWTGLTDFLKSEGFTESNLLESGLVLKSKSGRLYDKFRNRLMFPIISVKGEVLGFGGRLISGDGPKYLNSSETVVFKKGSELFGLNLARKANLSGKLILCEGYVDAVLLSQNGFENVVATLGTSLTKSQVLLLARVCNEVILAFDSDNAGVEAAKRAVGLFDEVGLKVKVLKLKQAKDPDEYINRFGASRFELLIKNAVNSQDFFFEFLKRNFDLDDVNEKREFIKKACEFIASQSDLIRRELYLNRLSSELNVSRSVLSHYVLDISTKNKNKFSKKLRKNLVSNVPITGLRERLEFSENFKFSGDIQQNNRLQRELLCAFVNQPSLRNYIYANVELTMFSDEFLRKVCSILFEIYKKGSSLKVFNLRNILSETEMSNFYRLINDFRKNEFTQNDVDFCVERLNRVYGNAVFNVVKLSAHDLEEKRKAKASLKI